MTQLPIEPLLPELRARLTNHRTLVLQAPPGAGKTTLVPLALMAEPWLAGRSILMLEPRRLAARAAAARMAELLGEKVGQRVGYRIRFESRVSRNTRIEVLTEGILTRRLQSDPELEGVGLVIFDEFHERSLHADLALALCRESQQALRDDLGLMVMSATLDGERVARLLDDAPIITSRGRSHPVVIRYLPRDPQGSIAATVAEAVLRALAESAGDILAFLPGAGEIRQTRERLTQTSACSALALVALYGDLPYADQQRAIQPDPRGRRKIVLATPIAETSLTIEGIGIVVDSGWARVPRFNPRSGLTRLETVRISADSAEQRAGRAGRLGPGVCYRLWSEATQGRLRLQQVPEILEADLAPLALELAQWGVREAGDLDWLDPPPTGALAQARTLLRELEAVDEQGLITPEGRAFAALPLHPRLAHMLIEGHGLGLGDMACNLAALLEERDILRGADAGSDLHARLEALAAFRNDPRQARRHGADPAACARVERATMQWRTLLKKAPKNTPHPTVAKGKGREAGGPGLLLALAYPDRIAQRRSNSPKRYRLANGRGALLPEHDPLAGEDWLVAAHVDAGAREGRIFLAAPVNPASLEEHLGGRIQDIQSVHWDDRQDAVSAQWQRRLGNLVLESRPLRDADPALLRRAMVEGIAAMGLEHLPWSPELRQWQARVQCLRDWFPGETWPDVSDGHLGETLGQWLEPYLEGITRREHLLRLDLVSALKSLLPWPLPPRLDELAPTHLQVPSGSRLRLSYTPGEAPVLAVKLQEMFGLAATPRIAAGRIEVTLHLLSPARRPIQVTRDLRGFWERTYPEVRKELKGRYPKHPWPDDPWNAIPTRHTRTRRSP